jgi:hypothetical protein
MLPQFLGRGQFRDHHNSTIYELSNKFLGYTELNKDLLLRFMFNNKKNIEIYIYFNYFMKFFIIKKVINHEF